MSASKKIKLKPHVHMHTFLKKANGNLMLEYKKVVRNPESVSKSMGQFKDELTKEFVIMSSTERYKFHKNEAVEYYVYKATLEGKEHLTIHVFSCYCEPLNENQAPPF